MRRVEAPDAKPEGCSPKQTLIGSHRFALEYRVPST